AACIAMASENRSWRTFSSPSTEATQRSPTSSRSNEHKSTACATRLRLWWSRSTVAKSEFGVSRRTIFVNAATGWARCRHPFEAKLMACTEQCALGEVHHEEDTHFCSHPAARVGGVRDHAARAEATPDRPVHHQARAVGGGWHRDPRPHL